MPPEVVLPGLMVSRFEPRPWIRFSICAVEPWPTDTMAITAPTPIRMPSAVSTARIRFCHSERSAERMFSHSSPGAKMLRRFACFGADPAAKLGDVDPGAPLLRAASRSARRSRSGRRGSARAASRESATSSSCVTMTMVMPARLRDWRMPMISLLVTLSRFPVGSSARISDGAFTSDRAMATRCCSPPDSSFGVWWPRFGRPTASSSSRAGLSRPRRPL